VESLLESKVILIVGAGGLLGCFLVSAILKQGGSVIAADINVSEMKKRLIEIGVDLANAKLTLESIDVTVEKEVKNFFKKIPRIDGAVNATYPRNKNYGKHFFEVTLANFNENVALHLGSTFLFTQQCALYYKGANNPFSLVNISSIYGVIAPKFKIYSGTTMTVPVEYAAIKSSILHLNKYVVAYVNDSKFRINCVSPGGIFDHQPDSFISAYREQTNGTGMLDVQEVIGSIMYLVSDQSRYVTGQNIIIDDGFHL